MLDIPILHRATKNLSSVNSQLMNGYIVGHPLFTPKRRDGKTWKWTQPWVTALAEPRKTSSSPKDARLRPPQTFTPLQGMQPAPLSKVQVSAAAGSLRKDFNSRSPLSRGTGEEDVLPTEGGSDRSTASPRPAPPTPGLDGAAASGTHPRRSGEDAKEAEGRQGLRNQRQPEAPSLLGPHSPSSARCCSA